jgi:hypothetical protein
MVYPTAPAGPFLFHSPAYTKAVSTALSDLLLAILSTWYYVFPEEGTNMGVVLWKRSFYCYTIPDIRRLPSLAL